MQKQCYCEQNNILDSFICYVCHKNHHWQCYDYQITDKQPQQLRCLQCSLTANNPQMQFETFVKLNNKFNVAIIKKPAQLLEKVFTFEVNQYYEELKKKSIILAIFCTKTKEPKKLYEWPSKNVYVELNNQHHIAYHINDYGFIPSTCIQWGANSIKVKVGEDVESNSLLGIVIVKSIKISELKSKLIDVGREKIIDSIITQQKQQYQDKIKSLSLVDDTLQDSLFSVKLIDGITMQQLEIPVRGKQCQHFDCFELNAYLTMNEKPNENRWKCPICNQLVPYDQLQVDFVLIDILHEIKCDHPKIFHKLQRVQLNQYLEYKIDEKYIEEETQIKRLLMNSQTLSQTVKINDVILEKATDSVVKFIQEFQRKDNYSSSLITFKSARKLLKKFHKKELFKNLETNQIQLSKFFIDMFDLSNYYQTYIFEDQIELQYYESLQDFELICKTIYQQTVSGLFIYYIKLFHPTVQRMTQSMAILCTQLNVKPAVIHSKKMLELILATAYDKEQKTSLGYNFKQICCMSKMRRDEYYSNVLYLSQMLSFVFYNTEISSFFIVRNCINLSNIFDLFYFQDKGKEDGQMDDYQLTIKLIKEVYSLKIIKENPNILDILRLILYLLSKRDRKFENVLDSFKEYNLGDVKSKFKNMEFNGEYYYL
ncbi:unnamed protein product [Paramecium octaurelia]|uniref:SP-RING-type domain-containing protein n=1 Tax=Paramecium octaurelia TaxID=43137 RepID=A0A8S1Y7J4_PAROT|nr:unnamed protein product [Paramecium octaurelia]